MKLQLLLLLATFVCCSGINGQVIFDDDDPPRRPPHHQHQHRPPPNTVRPGHGNGNGNGHNQNEREREPSGRRPDCRSLHDEDGICTPLPNCEEIGRMLRNRGPIRAARLLSRTLCGINGILPSVCCPIHERGNGDNFVEEPRPLPTPPPFNTRPPPFFGSSTTTRTRPFPTPTETPITKPPIQEGGGGGLIIVGPTQPPTPATSTRSPIIPADPSPNTTKRPGSLSPVGLPEECGFNNVSNTRIVGGTTAQKGFWPWIAALGYRDDTGNVNFLCGGALISKDYVVTASHCVHRKDDLAIVRLGDHDLFTNADGVTPMDVPIAEVIKHPEYNPSNFYNDIALLRLQRSVPFSKQIRPICLPSTPELRSQRFENLRPFVAGWGSIQFNGPSSSVLQQVQLPVVPESECQAKFKTFKSVNVDGTNICAGFASGEKDACQGDSGGPLMQSIGYNKYVLIGVVSFGFKCAEPGYPGVYSRVTTHLPWIESVINKR